MSVSKFDVSVTSCTLREKRPVTSSEGGPSFTPVWGGNHSHCIGRFRHQAEKLVARIRDAGLTRGGVVLPTRFPLHFVPRRSPHRRPTHDERIQTRRQRDPLRHARQPPVKLRRDGRRIPADLEHGVLISRTESPRIVGAGYAIQGRCSSWRRCRCSRQGIATRRGFCLEPTHCPSRRLDKSRRGQLCPVATVSQ